MTISGIGGPQRVLAVTTLVNIMIVGKRLQDRAELIVAGIVRMPMSTNGCVLGDCVCLPPFDGNSYLYVNAPGRRDGLVPYRVAATWAIRARSTTIGVRLMSRRD